MGKGKRRGGSGFEVEWITVSYRTVVAWVVVVVLPMWAGDKFYGWAKGRMRGM
jgi:hypothetical protein